MKKLPGIFVLGLLMLVTNLNSSNSTTKTKVFDKNSDVIIFQSSAFSHWDGEKEYAIQHCAKHNKYYVQFLYDANYVDKPYLARFFCVKDISDLFKYPEKYDNASTYTYKPLGIYGHYRSCDDNECSVKNLTIAHTNAPLVKFTTYEEYQRLKKEIESTIKNKKAEVKQICKDLGFNPKSERFADCVLKLHQLAFGSTQQ